MSARRCPCCRTFVPCCTNRRCPLPSSHSFSFSRFANLFVVLPLFSHSLQSSLASEFADQQSQAQVSFKQRGHIQVPLFTCPISFVLFSTSTTMQEPNEHGRACFRNQMFSFRVPPPTWPWPVLPPPLPPPLQTRLEKVKSRKLQRSTEQLTLIADLFTCVQCNSLGAAVVVMFCSMQVFAGIAVLLVVLSLLLLWPHASCDADS